MWPGAGNEVQSGMLACDLVDQHVTFFRPGCSSNVIGSRPAKGNMMKTTCSRRAARRGTRFMPGLACWLAAVLAVGINESIVWADDIAAAPVTVVGRITDKAGNPLAETLVRVATPEADMRFVYPGSGHRVFEVKTDEHGRYEVKVALNGATSLAVDAMKRGYRSAAGTFWSGGERRSASVKPGETFEASFVLPESLYVAGTVVNESGRPNIPRDGFRRAVPGPRHQRHCGHQNRCPRQVRGFQFSGGAGSPARVGI